MSVFEQLCYHHQCLFVCLFNSLYYFFKLHARTMRKCAHVFRPILCVHAWIFTNIFCYSHCLMSLGLKVHKKSVLSFRRYSTFNDYVGFIRNLEN